MLKDEVREGSTTAVVSENIDAVREVTTPDRHVTYRQIEVYFLLVECMLD